ncbi:MAG: hypothetical protein NTX22_16940 [Ignavibacteriales bacterium]|nr:hypothetical protein [Ignavibacteriales bacterium]
MKTGKWFLLLLLLLLSTQNYSQTITEKKLIADNPAERFVSFTNQTSLGSALDMIDKIIREVEKRRIVSELNNNTQIGIDINNIAYRKALLMLSEKNNFEITKTDSSYILTEKRNIEPISVREDSLVLNAKQIKVSALMFEVNTGELKERGINWQAIFSKHGMVLGSDYRSITPTPKNSGGPDYNLSLQIEGTIADKFSYFTNAVLKVLEEENLGKVVSKLSITVRNGQPGKMQVGSDFSIKQRDFAGNVMDTFFPTGIIIEVYPKIYSLDTLDYALLKLNVERSIAFPDPLSTEIKKTNATSEVIMYNDEEAVVGSLLYEQNVKIRNGIPVLKDLPWWVLGIRYLTGYEKYETMQREIILLIKINIIPSLIDRLRPEDKSSK